MSEGNKKPKWDKPKLIILTRGKPEERLLAGCKWANEDVSGYDDYNSKCMRRYPNTTCGYCMEFSTS
jgi:hypothetical protein